MVRERPGHSASIGIRVALKLTEGASLGSLVKRSLWQGQLTYSKQGFDTTNKCCLPTLQQTKGTERKHGSQGLEKPLVRRLISESFQEDVKVKEVTSPPLVQRSDLPFKSVVASIDFLGRVEGLPGKDEECIAGIEIKIHGRLKNRTFARAWKCCTKKTELGTM